MSLTFGFFTAPHFIASKTVPFYLIIPSLILCLSHSPLYLYCSSSLVLPPVFPRHLYDPEFARLGFNTFKAIVEANNDLCSVGNLRRALSGGGVSILQDLVVEPNASMRLRCLVKSMLLLKGGGGEANRLAPLMEAAAAALSKLKSEEASSDAAFAAAAAAAAKAVLESDSVDALPAQDPVEEEAEAVDAEAGAGDAEAPAALDPAPTAADADEVEGGADIVNEPLSAGDPPDAEVAVQVVEEAPQAGGDSPKLECGAVQVSDLEHLYRLLYGVPFGKGLASIKAELGAMRDVCKVMDGCTVLPPLPGEESEAMYRVRGEGES